MVAAGLSNLSLVKYLIGQLAASKQTKFAELQQFFPDAKPEDWYPITAGQRVQVIKKDPKKIGVLQFGTEVVAAGRRQHRGTPGRLARCLDGGADHARPHREVLPRAHGCLEAASHSDDPELRQAAVG